MPVYNYVDTVNDNLLCCICRMPFNEPVTTRACCHTFCRECISTALHLSQHCPIDRSPLALNDLSPADPLIRNLVDELLVECPMQPEGCSYAGQRQLLDSHIKENCLYMSAPCQDGLCNQSFLRKDAKHEVHADRSKSGNEEVLSRKAECEGCTTSLAETELQSHRATCPGVIVNCDQSRHGCEWKDTRSKLKEHLGSCPYQAVKGFFALHDTQVSALSEENAVLRHKICALDGIITSLRRELSTVQSALGPWYRPNMRTLSQTQSPPPSHSVVEHAHDSGPSEPMPHPDGTPALPQPAPLLSLEDLSSYFPVAEPDDWLPMDYRSPNNERTLHSIPQVSATPSTSSIPPQTQAVQSPPASRSVSLPYTTYPQPPVVSSPPQSLIAPLDLSTTLEGSLLGLRSSIVTVSAALDSLTRRQDVALTTESMRTAEEIRSLRAIIHGLRMQVHSIIMDRNAQATGHSGEETMGQWLPDLHAHEGMVPWMRVPPPFQPRYTLGGLSSGSGSAPKL